MSTIALAPATVKPAATSSVNWRVNAPATDPAWAWEQFRLGRDLFAAGEEIAACVTAEQRRGWRVAYRHNAQAHCGIVNGVDVMTGKVWA